MPATVADLAAAALARWEVEDESGWHPCDQKVLECLRVAGAGQKLHVPCAVGERKCELHLDARVEVDCMTGKRRRLRIASPTERETAAVAAAAAAGATLPSLAESATKPVLEPGQSAEAGRLPRKTLSGYFIKTKESKESKEPAEQAQSSSSAAVWGGGGGGGGAAGPDRPSAEATASGSSTVADIADPKTGNEKIASIFEEMSMVQKLKRDRFRSQAYAKAAQALRALDHAIDSGAQAKAIKGIGAGMANRIDVILKTGELQELEDLKNDSDVVALRELRSVHGIGAVAAAKLVEQGIRSLLQLRQAVEKKQVHLDAAQALGLRHCEEFNKRIPQAEMKEHHAFLERCRVQDYPALLLTVCGSYRRGRPDCGDIDVLISHPNYTTAKKETNAGGKLLHGFVNSLKKVGYVTGDLAFGQTKFMGVCRLPGGLHRRLDIRCMPEDQYHFGMLYFTGSAALSVKMRLKAIDMGMTLSEYGLENKVTGEKVTARSEEEIFRALGMEYLEPWQR